MDEGSNTDRRGYRAFHGGRKDSQFVDGKSNTAAFAEKLAGDRNPETLTAWRDATRISDTSMVVGPNDAMTLCQTPVDPADRHYSFGGYTWLLSGYHQTWYNHVLTPNSHIPDCNVGNGAVTARSLHPGGVNLLMADGSVHFISASIAMETWRAIGSVDGRETASLGD
jgi:prepilin-type processing-associated H-X9-DG protein